MNQCNLARACFAIAAVWHMATGPASGAAAVADVGLLPPGQVELTLRSRDAEGQVTTRAEAVDPRKVAVVLVDTWNFHWCMTATQRCGSFVPRFNRATQAARRLGMHVFWCPTDVADMHAAAPQRQRALATPRVPFPPSRGIVFADIQCFESNGCMCGPGLKCLHNYGWDGMAPGLEVADEDLIPETAEELYAVCKAKGISHLIYFGFHTNVCTTGKPVGIRTMANAGLRCVLARDMTDGISGYDPAAGHHPDGGTEEIIRQIEQQVPTIHMADELKKLKLWDDSRTVDPVRVAPWGTPRRPYLFEESTIVTLSAPLNEGAAIHYTLDGAPPTPRSPKYEKPFKVAASTTVRAAAFAEGGRAACLETTATLLKLPPVPPKPDVTLDRLTPLRGTSAGFHSFGSDKVPVVNGAFGGGKILLRGAEFDKGAGVVAPSTLLYAVDPAYDRFVGRAGLDENIIRDDLARGAAMYPSAAFRVLIDGEVVAESPLLRFHNEPWRFDVKIPAGARTISLVATDGGDGNRHDRADWADAGFVLKAGGAPPDAEGAGDAPTGKPQ